MGVDYKVTFSPKANNTSIQVLVQIAAQYDLDLRKMDVKNYSAN